MLGKPLSKTARTTMLVLGLTLLTAAGTYERLLPQPQAAERAQAGQCPNATPARHIRASLGF